MWRWMEEQTGVLSAYVANWDNPLINTGKGLGPPTHNNLGTKARSREWSRVQKDEPTMRFKLGIYAHAVLQRVNQCSCWEESIIHGVQWVHVNSNYNEEVFAGETLRGPSQDSERRSETSPPREKANWHKSTVLWTSVQLWLNWETRLTEEQTHAHKGTCLSMHGRTCVLVFVWMTSIPLGVHLSVY